MQLEVGDGEMQTAPGAPKVKVKVLQIRTQDGVTVAIPIPADAAKQIGDALAMTESGLHLPPANGMPQQ